jgi:glycosyltransferase involved in cell wall biosynthesis
MKSKLVLLTKHYPFGKTETYLNNEIPFLLSAFDVVIIVPVEEFDYDDLNHLCFNNPRIKVIKINQFTSRMNFWDRFIIQFYALLDILREIVKGRESMQHFKRFRMCFVYSKLTYNQAYSLQDKLTEEGDFNQFSFYSYWLHKSVLLLRGLQKRSNKKLHFVSRAHSSDLYHKNWSEIMRISDGGFMPFEQTKLKTCDEIFTISDHGLQHLNKHFPDLNGKFKLSRLGVLPPPNLSPVHDWSKFRIVTCSAIQPHKRIYRIPEILALLNYITIEWVHFGSGAPNDVSVLNREIEKYGLEKNVTMKAHVAHEEIIRFYSYEQVNLILNLSYAEGIPVSLMEAISAGIPAIATKAVGNPEIIDSRCGFLIPVDFTAIEVAEKIRTLYHDKDLQVKLRNGAVSMYKERYSAEVNYKNFAVALRS